MAVSAKRRFEFAVVRDNLHEGTIPERGVVTADTYHAAMKRVLNLHPGSFAAVVRSETGTALSYRSAEASGNLEWNADRKAVVRVHRS